MQGFESLTLRLNFNMEVILMKSPYEVESERIAVSFVISFIILVIIALVFHKELISYLSYLVTKLSLI